MNLPDLSPEYTNLRTAIVPPTWLCALQNLTPQQQAAVIFTLIAEHHLQVEALNKKIERLDELLAHHANHEENP